MWTQIFSTLSLIFYLSSNMSRNSWKRVLYRRKTGTKWEATGRDGEKESGDLSSFFFPKFHDNWKAKDLYEVFMKLRDIEPSQK